MAIVVYLRHLLKLTFRSMMKKLLSLFLFAVILTPAKAQVFPIYQNDFEVLEGEWISSFSTGPNEWLRNTCAGNGPSMPGTHALYITPGGTDEDCGPTGKYRYAYENALSMPAGAITQIEIDASCAGTLTANFDYQMGGLAAEDYLEFVYSLDGGGTYTVISTLASAGSWTTLSIPLPALLDFSVFRIGFRFIYNDNDIYGIAPAIDNFVITGVDTQDPVITECVPNQTVNLDDNCSVIVGDMTPLLIASDNCTATGDLTITQTPAPGTITFTNTGQSQVYTATVTDLAGNSSQCVFSVIAVDNTPPELICPPSVTVFFSLSCEASVPDLNSEVSWTDNCTSVSAQMDFQQSIAPGTPITANTTVNYVVSDPSGNMGSCDIEVLVVDNISPVLTCPSDQTQNANAACFADLIDYTNLVGVVENCFFGDEVVLVQSPSASTLISGTTLITISGTDESGNASTCNFNVTVLDVTDPTLTCPTNQTASLNTDCDYSVADFTGLVTAADNCTGGSNFTFNQTPAAGTIVSAGIHTIVIEIIDEAMNTATCSFDVNALDLSAPEITCSGNVILGVNALCEGVIENYSSNLVASDNCSILSALTITQNPPAGTVVFANTQIEFTVADEAGNSNTCNFFAIVEDLAEPTVVCPNSMSVSINSSCQYTVPDILTEVTGTDNCSLFENMTLTQNPAVGATESGLTAVLITLQDEAGNQGTCITLLIPDDTEAPVVTCPSPAPINNGSNCDFVLPNYASITLVLDNCSNFTIEQSPAAGTIVQPGTSTIEMTVSDVAGNMVTCSFDLVITENVIPTITCPSNVSTCNPIVTYTDPSYNDNCSAVVTQTDGTGLSSGSTFPVGSTILSYQVADFSGNTANCSFVVEVLDYPAQATIADDTLYLCDLTSTVVSAEAHTTGSGEWTVLSGNGNFNNQFANTTGVNNLNYGTNVLVYTIGTASCGFTSDTVVIIASQQPLPASTQDTIYTCASTEVVLLSNTPLYGNGVWSTNDVNAVIANAASSNTNATNLSAGWHEYIWTITNGSCPSTSDTLRVFTSHIATISTADTLICFEDASLNLVAVTPSGAESVLWKFIKGVGILGSPTAAATTVTGLNLGENILVYTVSHPICPSSTDTLIIVTQLCNAINPDFPTVITPNNDGKNDLFVINFIEQIYPDLKVTIFNRWGSIVFESTGYEVPWDGNYNGEPLPMGTYFYRIELNDSENKVYTGPISIIR
jgi:gliding motility-associated-like protein